MTLRRGKNQGKRKPSVKHPHHSKYAGHDVRAANCFVWMLERVNSGTRPTRVCEFERTRAGFLEFVAEMGDIPKGMKRPSVGRIDHDKGYVKGNIQWEEHSFNTWRQRRPEEPPLPLDETSVTQQHYENDLSNAHSEEEIPF